MIMRLQKTNHNLLRSLCLGLVIILCAFLIRLYIIEKRNPANIITSSSLREILDINQLSTTELHYAGIAHIYNNVSGNIYIGNKHGIVGSIYNPLNPSDALDMTKNIIDTAIDRFTFKCHICYRATIKMGIDINRLVFDVDNTAKVIKATLPKIGITTCTVDEKSIDIMPGTVRIDLPDILKACEMDAVNEIATSGELSRITCQNLKKSIEGFLFPVIRSEGYTLIWKDAE